MINANIKYALKIGVTLMALAFVFPYLNLPQSYWVLITIIAVTLPTVGATLARSKIRGAYTAIGVLLGSVISFTLKDNLVVILCVAAPILFLSSYYILIEYRRFVFFLSILLVIMLGAVFHESWHFAYWRFMNTVIGVGIAVIVSLVVFPCWSKNAIENILNDTLDHLFHFVSLALADKEISFQDLEQARFLLALNTEKMKRLFDEVAEEVDPCDKRLIFYESLIRLVENIRFNGSLLFAVREGLEREDCIKPLREVANHYFENIFNRAVWQDNQSQIIVKDQYLNTVVSLFVNDVRKLHYTLASIR